MSEGNAKECNSERGHKEEWFCPLTCACPTHGTQAQRYTVRRVPERHRLPTRYVANDCITNSEIRKYLLSSIQPSRILSEWGTWTEL